MLLPINSKKTFSIVLIMALSMLAGQAASARSLNHGGGKASHGFLSRLPRTNKARKYDTFFLNQLPRQTIAFNNGTQTRIAGKPDQYI